MATDDDTPAGDVDAGDQGDDGAGDASADDDRTPRASRSGGASGGVPDGVGWVLGLVLWAGVVLPFIHNGPSGVKAWWMAKFLNKAPDGSELP